MSATNTEPKVEYKQLGKSGLRVSVPIVFERPELRGRLTRFEVGAMSFGTPEWAVRRTSLLLPLE